MSHPRELSSTRKLFIAGVLLFATAATACSGSADVTLSPTTTTDATAPSAAEPQTDSEPVEAAVPAAAPQSGSVDCEALHRARVGYQGAGGNLIYVDSAEFLSDIVGDVDALRADVEAFRPYQDVDAVPFGPIREGLDNFTNDLDAAVEGRYDDIAGSYKSAGMNGLLAHIGC